MPKTPVSSKLKLSKLTTEFKNELIEENSGSLFCAACGIILTGLTKFLVKQHVETGKHKANFALKNKQTTLIAPKKKDFPAELCEAFVSANIPLKKLENTTFRNFLEKHIQRKLPSETTIRRNYLEDAKNDVLKKIRADIGDNSIYVSIDETTDKEGRYIANVIVGALQNSPSRPHLIHLEHLEKTNAQTITRAIDNAPQILWPDGIKRDRVLLFVTDGAAYMKKVSKDLAILYSKMIHVTCLARELHRVAEHIRNTFLKADNLVNNVKKILLKAPYRVQLLKDTYPEIPVPPKPIITRWGTWLDAIEYYVIYWSENLEDESLVITKTKKLFNDPEVLQELHQISEFSILTQTIKNLQNTRRPMKETLNIWDEAVQNISSSSFPSIKNKMNDIAMKNSGIQLMKFIDCSNIQGLKEFPQFTNASPKQLLAYKYAPLVSADVERSFSLYKLILEDHRRNFLVKNLRSHMIIAFYHQNA